MWNQCSGGEFVDPSAYTSGMTPKYETTEDVERELEFASDIARLRQVEMNKVKGFSRIDYIMSRHNEAVALCELKCRRISSTQYPTLIVGYDKFESGLYVGEFLGLPLVIFMRLLDKDMFYIANKEDAGRLKVEFSGRTKDTRGPSDLCHVIHIPVELFSELEEKTP